MDWLPFGPEFQPDRRARGEAGGYCMDALQQFGAEVGIGNQLFQLAIGAAAGAAGDQAPAHAETMVAGGAPE